MNIDGTPRLVNGKVAETYVQDDVSQMARVFTGWDSDLTKPGGDSTERLKNPMAQIPTRHELGEKRFLTTVIPAGTDGVQSLKIADGHRQRGHRLHRLRLWPHPPSPTTARTT